MKIEDFGAYIAQKRKERNMTQRDLAEKLHVTPKAVSRWERCVGYPDIETLEALASALGIPVQNLFACSDTGDDIDTDSLMKIVHDSVEIDRKNNRIQERCVSGIILAGTLLVGILFYAGGFGNIGASVFFGLLSSGALVSLYYLLSEDNVQGRRIYGGVFVVLLLAVAGILCFSLRG